MTFKHFPHTNAWGRKFDLAVKKAKGNLRSTFDRPWVHDAIYTKIQPQSFLGSGEEDFKCFTIYGHGGHLVPRPETIQTNCLYPFDRRLHVKMGKIARAVLIGLLKFWWALWKFWWALWKFWWAQESLIPTWDKNKHWIWVASVGGPQPKTNSI